MKLIHCNKCLDVVALRDVPRTCLCGESSGHYVDDLNAEISGDCMPLGFANPSFRAARLLQPKEGWGERFEAFVIPKACPSIKVTRRKRSSRAKP